jgi:hypothetical protein
MNKIYLFLLTVVFAITSGAVALTSTAHASEHGNGRVLLVYDSQNTVKQGEKKIDTLQRMLTGMGLKVTTVKESEYKKGELNQGYQGVITLINWKQAGLVNSTFIHDRNQYDGIKLHIGEGLDETEQHQLQVELKTVYQQQLILDDEQNTEILPFITRMDVLTGVPKKAQTFGELKNQSIKDEKYAYGVINQHQGYLPFFNNKGLGLITASKMIATLFDRQQETKPLLTITGVSPYSNLKMLDKLSAYCEDIGVPLAISTVTVDKNTEMQAYKRFTRYLRKIEDRGNVIFLQAPVIGGATKANAMDLSELFDNYLLNLAQNQIYPVGISAQGFWNQDRILRNNALKKASYWMMLPNTKTVYLDQDDQAGVSERSYVALSAATFNKIDHQEDVRFAMPTALTMKMPDSDVKLQNLKEQIRAMDFSWQDPEEEISSKIDFASSGLAYRNGQYLVNGKETEIDMHLDVEASTKPKAKPALFRGFFKVQGRIITVFFAIIFTILVIFIALGRKIYKRMFKR